MRKNQPAPRRSVSLARERILKTAHDLFYRDGIRATGIDRIIEEAAVTKVTFYRHFPSKNDLIKAYLEYRHELWMGWFIDAVNRYKGRTGFALDAVAAALREWFQSDGYRGCAFINGVVELDGALPDVGEISRRHKDAVTKVICGLLPESAHRDIDAQAVVLAIDGAIIRVQMEKSPEASLKVLEVILRSL